MKRGGKLDVIGPEFAREGRPFFDGQIRVGVALLARRQLLQRGGQNADLHEFRLESFDGHSASLLGISLGTHRFQRAGALVRPIGGPQRAWAGCAERKQLSPNTRETTSRTYDSDQYVFPPRL